MNGGDWNQLRVCKKNANEQGEGEISQSKTEVG